MPAKKLLRRIKRVARTNPLAVLLVLTVISVGVFSIYFANTALQQRQSIESDAAGEIPLIDMLGRGRLGEKTYADTMQRIPALDADGYSAFAVPCTVKVLPNVQIPTQTISGPVVKLAKNETRCFQISIKSPQQKALPEIRITTSNPNITTKAYIEGYVTIETPTRVQFGNPKKAYRYSNYTGQVPDPLIPLFDPKTDANSLTELRKLRATHATLPANTPRSLLIEVTTTKSSPVGNQSLTVQIGQKSAVLPILVYNFTLPDTLALKTSYNTANIGTAGQGFSAGHNISSAQDKTRLMNDYYHEDLNRFGIDPYSLYWAEIVYGQENGRSTLTNLYNCQTDTFRLSTGAEKVLKKYLDGDENGDGVLERRPATSFQITHLGATQYDKKDGFTICGINWDQPGWEANAKKFIKAMQRYFDTHGWTDKAFYNIDEPSIPYENQSGVTRPLPLASQVDEIGQPNGYKRMWLFSKVVLENSDFKIGSTTTVTKVKWQTDDRLALPNSSGAAIPGKYPFNNPIPVNDLDNVLANGGWYSAGGYGLFPGECNPNAPSFQKQCLRPSDESWFYYVNDPAFDLESVAQDQIMLGWTSYKYRQAGILFWSTIWWGGQYPNKPAPADHPEYGRSYFLNPWTHANNFYWTNLSSTFFYPPCGTDSCRWPTFYTIPSLRLVLMREGILDYEYMHQLERKSGRSTAMRIAGLDTNELISKTAGWNDNPRSVAEKRDAIARALTGALPLTHLVCQNNQCVSVTGSGNNTCATDTDCAPVVQTHLECSNSQCVSVNGAGSNLCATNADCSVPPEDIAYTVKKATVPPILDGKLPEYSSITPISFYGTDVYPVWNSSGLYLGVKVADSSVTATHTKSSCAGGNESDCEVWRDDSIEWFIDMLNDKGGQANRSGVYMKSDDYHGITNVHDARVDNRGDDATTRPNFQWNGNWQSRVVKTGAGYTIELFIPWGAVGGTPDANSVIGLGLARNDASGSAVSSKLWKDRGSNFQNASNWNPVQLSLDTVTLLPTYISRNQDFSQNADEWTFWKRDNTFATGNWENGTVRLTATQNGAWTCWFQDIDVKQYQGKKAIISGRFKSQSFDTAKPLPYIAFNAQDTSGVWANDYGGSVTFPIADSYSDVKSNAIAIGNSIEMLKAKVCMSDAKSGSVLIADSVKVEVQN